MDFALSEDLPLVQGEVFTAGGRGSAPRAIDGARPDRRTGGESAHPPCGPARTPVDSEMVLFAGDDRFGALGVSVSADRYIPRHLGPHPRLRDLAPLSAAMQDLQTQAPMTAEMQRLIRLV